MPAAAGLMKRRIIFDIPMGATVTLPGSPGTPPQVIDARELFEECVLAAKGSPRRPVRSDGTIFEVMLRDEDARLMFKLKASDLIEAYGRQG